MGWARVTIDLDISLEWIMNDRRHHHEQILIRLLQLHEFMAARRVDDDEERGSIVTHSFNNHGR